MYTYQDLTDIGKDEQKRIDFVYNAIQQHKASKEYETAVIADEYDKQQNRTMVRFQKTITTMTGKIIPDNFSASYKMCSNFYNRLTTQRVQYSLSNGVKWTGTTVAVPIGTRGATPKFIFEPDKNGNVNYREEWQVSAPTGIKEKLGSNFDTQLQKLCKAGIDGGVSFGFLDVKNRHKNETETYTLKVFKITEFAPLYDEENGSLRAGIRWVQVDPKKPLRATLYEEDGFTEYIWNERIEDGKRITEGQIYKLKRPYKIERAEKGSIDEGEIYNGENYPAFPIVPFFANEHKQSAIVGMREHIDAYDLNKNGYANELDNAIVYWVLKGAAGFDDVEATAFVQKIKALGVANTENDQDVQAIPVNPPIDGRERLLDRIEKDIYKDFGALDIDQVKSGAVTATQIRAAYEALDMAANQFEYQILEFLDRLMIVAGVKDTATFTRATLVNSTETLQMLLQAAPFLTEDYVITKTLELFGDGDKADYIINQRKAEELNRFGIGTNEEEEVKQNQEQEIEAEEKPTENLGEDNV